MTAFSGVSGTDEQAVMARTSSHSAILSFTRIHRLAGIGSEMPQNAGSVARWGQSSNAGGRREAPIRLVGAGMGRGPTTTGAWRLPGRSGFHALGLLPQRHGGQRPVGSARTPPGANRSGDSSAGCRDVRHRIPDRPHLVDLVTARPAPERRVSGTCREAGLRGRRIAGLHRRRPA